MDKTTKGLIDGAAADARRAMPGCGIEVVQAFSVGAIACMLAAILDAKDAEARKSAIEFARNTMVAGSAA